MKYLNWKKAAFFILLGAFLLQVIGCGNSKAENTTADKEFVYVAEYQKLKAEDGIDDVFVEGDTIYYVTGSWKEEVQRYMEYLAILKIGEETPEMIPLDFGEESDVQRVMPDKEGNFLAILATNVYEDEENDGEDTKDQSEEDIAEGGEAQDGEDAGAENDDSSVEEDDTEKGSEEAAAAEGGEELSYEVVDEGSGSSGRAHGGVVYSSGGTATFFAGDDEEWRMPTRILELCRFSKDGSVISRIDISDALDGNADMYVQNMEMDGDGNLYIALDQNVIVIDAEGRRICKLEVTSWINDMFSAKDGTVYAVYYGDMDLEAHPIDIHAKAMGDAVKNIMVAVNGGYTFATGIDTDLVYSAGSDLYTYTFGEEAPKKILNWIDCNIDRDDVRSFAVLEDGRVLVLISSWDSESGMSTAELVYLTKKKGSEVPEQKILTYGTMYLDYYVRKQIIEFNRTNQEYRVEVKEYVTENSMEGYGSGLEQMNTDIISGKGPDIIELSGGNMRMYAAKGILEDLYPYMDADEEISREDFLENVKKAYEIDGKLYTLPPRFYINTVLAKVSKVGERNSITLDELMEIADALPEGAQLYEYATKSSILLANIMMNLDEYVNWNTGECKFGSEDFIKALEFANRFDAEFQWNQDDMSRPEKIRQDVLLMTQTSISSMQEYIMFEAMFGEPIAFVGYPTTKDNGSFLSHDGSSMAINAKSKYKDGAWQFIRGQLTEEAQEGSSVRGGFGFPVRKSALEKQFEEDMTEEYYEDVDGSKKRNEKTNWGYDGFEVRIFAAKDYEVETVRELIENTDTLYQYDEKMMEIVSEEANAFFEGQKSAKEVADIIQNRIQVYVNENR